jgi:hypothetical protein
MRFRLQQKSANQSITKFHVLDQQENIVGSINVRNGEVPDLLAAGLDQRDHPNPKNKTYRRNRDPG